jgi:hypothetical protein
MKIYEFKSYSMVSLKNKSRSDTRENKKKRGWTKEQGQYCNYKYKRNINKKWLPKSTIWGRKKEKIQRKFMGNSC